MPLIILLDKHRGLKRKGKWRSAGLVREYSVQKGDSLWSPNSRAAIFSYLTKRE